MEYAWCTRYAEKKTTFYVLIYLKHLFNKLLSASAKRVWTKIKPRDAHETLVHGQVHGSITLRPNFGPNRIRHRVSGNIRSVRYMI